MNLIQAAFNESEISFISASEYIHSLAFNNIIDKLIRIQHWTKIDAVKTAAYYKNYLILLKKHPTINLPPSEDIDEFWHQHILDTREYMKDCQNIFGCYLHHYPYFGIDGLTTLADLNHAFTMTQQLYFEEFGHHIEPTKSRYPKFIYYMLNKFL